MTLFDKISDYFERMGQKHFSQPSYESQELSKKISKKLKIQLQTFIGALHCGQLTLCLNKK